ncbi:MAG: molybdopterin-dependent oxidoreductase [Dehalococcoidia bacterium]|jgi:anaerobic selenocysteine-containing dehydrogenase
MKQEPDTLNNGESPTSGSKDSNRKTKQKKEKSGRLLLSRRAFLGVSAAATAALTAGYALKRPEAQFLSPSDSIYETFNEEYIATSCLNCPTRCSTVVKMQESDGVRAVKISGNPLSKASDGKTCPRCKVGLQVLYAHDRIKSPLKRTNPQKGKGIDPIWTEITWGEALAEISGKLKSLRSSGEPHKLLILDGLNSHSNEDLVRRFAEAFGTPNLINGDALEDEASKAGEWMADGHYTISAYDLENTNYILAFGAGIIESQKPLARNLRMWGKIRREKAVRTKVVVVDPRYSVTAAKSDMWIPIKPGTDAALAMSIANVIISEGLYDSNFISNWTSGFAEYKDLALRQYSPESVSAITGIDADVIRQIAREFAAARPAIAWRGRGATCWPNGSYASYAIFCLNALVGSIDVPGGVIYQEYPEYRGMPEIVKDSIAEAGNAQEAIDQRGKQNYIAAKVVTNQAADSILNGTPYAIEMAIGLNSNFNMFAPGTDRWNRAMAKLPFYVHISPSLTEMSEYADIVLPACTFLEDWAYEHCLPGSGFTEVKIKQPVIDKLGDSMPLGDIIFNLAGQIGDSVAESFENIGDNNTQGFVRYRTENIISWSEFRNKGVWVGPDYQFYKYDTIFDTPSKKFEFYSGNMEALLKSAGMSVDEQTACLPHYTEPEFVGSEGSYPLNLVTYQPALTIEGGSQNYPWAQELLLVLHGYGWKNFVEINKETADHLKIKDGDQVWVESPMGKLKSRARVFHGIHPEVVAIARGQGRYYDGEWSNDIGVNPNDITGVNYDSVSGQSAFFNTRVKVYKA